MIYMSISKSVIKKQSGKLNRQPRGKTNFTS
jgi:hypothetical protein